MTNSIKNIEAKKLLISNMCFRWGRYITTIFVNLYILSLVNSISFLALFNIIYLFWHLLWFISISPTIKYKNRKFFLFLWILIQILSYIILLLFSENILNFAFFFAFIIGIWWGFYWAVFNINEFDSTNKKNRWNFQWIKKVLKNIMTIFIPTLCWYLIIQNWYNLGLEFVFFIALLSNIWALYFWNISFKHSTYKPFQIKKLVSELYKNKDFIYFYLSMLIIWIILSPMMISTIIPMIMYAQGIEIGEVWYITAIFWWITIISTYLLGKFMCYTQYKKTYYGIILAYCILILLLFIIKIPVFIIVVWAIINLLVTLISIPTYVYRSNLLHEIDGYQELKVEYMCVAEIFLLSWWIISYIIIYILWNLDYNALQIFFWINLLLWLISIYLFKQIKFNIKK